MAGFRSKFRRRLFAIVKRRIERFISGIAVSLPLAFHNHLSRFCSDTPALIRGRQCSVSNASLLSGSVDTIVGRGGKLCMLLVPTVSGHRFKFHCNLLHWTKVSSVTTHDKKRYSTFLRLRVISIKSVTRSCRPLQQRLGHIYRLWHRATIAMKYVELIQNVHTGSVMSNILKHLTQTPIVFCFYDETLRRFRRIVPEKMAEQRDPPTAGSMEVARLFLAKSATCLMRMKVQSSDCRVSTTLQI